ncbi:hypothetical protein FB451DRAFT_1396811 [Mycena latifolia]|nr:hypothetical protein FB451DRAFT_1396811 [Mycena latifolia]
MSDLSTPSRKLEELILTQTTALLTPFDLLLSRKRRSTRLESTSVLPAVCSATRAAARLRRWPSVDSYLCSQSPSQQQLAQAHTFAPHRLQLRFKHLISRGLVREERPDLLASASTLTRQLTSNLLTLPTSWQAPDARPRVGRAGVGPLKRDLIAPLFDNDRIACQRLAPRRVRLHFRSQQPVKLVERVQRRLEPRVCSSPCVGLDGLRG